MTQALEQNNFIDSILPRIQEMRPGDLFISMNVSGIRLDPETIRENFNDARARLSARFTDFNLFEGTFKNKELFDVVFQRYNEYLQQDLCFNKVHINSLRRMHGHD